MGLEKHKKIFGNSIGESTVSTPASMWKNPNTSQNSSSRSVSSSSQNPWLNSSRNSFSKPVFSNLSSNSGRTSVTSDQMNLFSGSSRGFSSSSSYMNDRLMQMD